MSVTLDERPDTLRAAGGGLPARRAVIRWALRLLRREWRQQLLIMALVTVAVAATVVASAVATDAQAPVAGTLGTAHDAAVVSGPSATINAGIAKIQGLYGKTDVIENQSVPVPGTQNTFDLRAQDPRGPFGGPMLSLVSGRYPAGAGQVAVTTGVASDFRLSTGKSWTVNGRAYTVTGIVRNPESLLDDFALVTPGQVTSPTTVTVLFNGRGAAGTIASATRLNVIDAQSLQHANLINPQTISVAAVVLGMLLIALVGVGGFSVLAQRRLRAIGMLAAQGATQRHIRTVVRANGAATGVAGAAAGFVLGFCAAAFALFGAAGASNGNGGGMAEVAGGFITLTVAILLLAPALLGVVAAAGRRSPIAARLALRDLARYRVRSGPALAAISLATLIAVIICVVSAARFGNVLDYVGPNLTSSQLVVHAPNGPNGPNGTRQAQQTADRIAGSLGVSPAGMVPLEQADAHLNRAAAGRSWSGPLYVATPQLLNAFGIKQSQVNPDADILTMRPALSTLSKMQFIYGSPKGGPDGSVPGGDNGNSWPCPSGSCVANPPIQELSQLPTGTSAPNTVITEHAVSEYHLAAGIQTTAWLITMPKALSPAQIARAQQIAAGSSGMSVETRDSVPSLQQIIDVATVFGIALALGILGMSAGLVRAEAGRDLRTLTATGASARIRRTITATTAGALALTGAMIGIAGGYLAATGFFRSNDLDGLSSLSAIPVANLLAILVGMPLAAVILGWLLSGREPAAVSRQPLE